MKEVNIQIPEGYEIDEENSTFTCIKFKVKSVINKIASYSDRTDGHDFSINGNWAFTHIKDEREGHHYTGSQTTGHGASLYLEGEWFTQAGTPIRGYLYYKPTK